MSARLKIIGKFDVRGTRVFDSETGYEITNIKKVTWTHEAGKLPTCSIELADVNCEAEAQTDFGGDRKT